MARYRFEGFCEGGISLEVHELKILPEYYNAVNEEIKTFEIRKNDRNYQVGDVLHLKEWDAERYTNNSVYVQVTYITDYAQIDDYVVLAIQSVPNVMPIYLKMSGKEKKVFQELISHKHIYGIDHLGRDGINTYWDIMNVLLEHHDINGRDEQWFMELWDED